MPISHFVLSQQLNEAMNPPRVQQLPDGSNVERKELTLQLFLLGPENRVQVYTQ